MIFELLDLKEWKKKKNILKELKKNGVRMSERAFNQLVKASKTLKAMGENDNIRLEIKNGEFIVAQF